MHHIRFPLGLRPKPHEGSLQRSPRSPIWGLLLRGIIRGGIRAEKGNVRERGGEEKGRDLPD